MSTGWLMGSDYRNWPLATPSATSPPRGLGCGTTTALLMAPIEGQRASNRPWTGSTARAPTIADMALAADNDEEASVRLMQLAHVQNGTGFAQISFASGRSKTTSRPRTTTFTASTPIDPSKAMPVNTVFSWFIRKRLHQIELFRRLGGSSGRPAPPHRRPRRHPLRTGARHWALHLAGRLSSAGALRDYNGLKPWIHRVGMENPMCSGPALSNGTPNPPAQPPTAASSSRSRRRWNAAITKGQGLARDVCGRRSRPGSTVWHLIVGGTGRTEEADNGALTGDLSAIIIDNLP